MMRTAARLGFLIIITVAAAMIFEVSVAQAFAAAVFALVVMEVGLIGIRILAAPVPAPPDPGELRKVKLEYRCSVCGTELRMTAALSEDPVAPRHCMEEMDLLTVAG